MSQGGLEEIPVLDVSNMNKDALQAAVERMRVLALQARDAMSATQRQLIAAQTELISLQEKLRAAADAGAAESVKLQAAQDQVRALTASATNAGAASAEKEQEIAQLRARVQQLEQEAQAIVPAMDLEEVNAALEAALGRETQVRAALTACEDALQKERAERAKEGGRGQERRAAPEEQGYGYGAVRAFVVRNGKIELSRLTFAQTTAKVTFPPPSELRCASSSVLDFLDWWDKFSSYVLRAALSAPQVALLLRHLESTTCDHLRIENVAWEQQVAIWQRRVDGFDAQSAQFDAERMTKGPRDRAYDAILRARKAWQLPLQFAPDPKVAEAAVIRTRIWHHSFLGREWIQKHDGLFRHVSGKDPQSFVDLLELLLQEGERGTGETAVVTAAPGVARATHRPAQAAVPTGRRTGPAGPLPGQDPMPDWGKEAVCFKCGDTGHVGAWCPNVSPRTRARAAKAQQGGRAPKGHQGRAQARGSAKTSSESPAVNAAPAVQGAVGNKPEEGYMSFEEQNVHGERFPPLSIAGEVFGTRRMVGIDTWCTRSLIRKSVVPKEAQVRDARVPIQGLGSVTSEGIVRCQIGVAGGQVIDDDFLVVPDLIAPALVSWGTALRHGYGVDKNGRNVQLMGYWQPTLSMADCAVLGYVAWGCVPCKFSVDVAGAVHGETHAAKGDSRPPESGLSLSGTVTPSVPVVVAMPAAPLFAAAMEHANVSHVTELLGQPSPLLDDELAPDVFGELAEAMTEQQKIDVLAALKKTAREADALDGGHKEQLWALLQEFADVFSPQLMTAGRSGMSVSINTNGKVPAVQQPRPFHGSDELRARLFERLEHFYDAGLLEAVDPAMPHYPSNLVLQVRNGKLRLAHDVMPTNLIAETDHFPVPAPREVVQRTAKAVIFSSVDQTDAYYQITMAPEVRGLCCFHVPEPGLRTKDGKVHRLLQWTCVTQGYKNAPAIMHRFNAEIFQEFSPEQCSIMFDDAALYSGDDGQSDPQDEHLALLRRFFMICRLRRLLLKPTKCAFGKTQVKHQGFLISHGKWEKDPAAVKPILDLPYPKSKKDLQALLGTFQVYANFIPAFAQIAMPLYELTKKLHWHQDAFVEVHKGAVDQLKTALATATALAMPDYNKPFYFRVDSGPAFGIAGAICQMRDGQFAPLEFHSRKATPAEQNYWAPEMELQGIVWLVCEKGRRYANAGKSYVLNDGKYIKDLPKRLHETASKRILNGLLKLQAIDLSFVWLPRSQMVDVDTLNRCATSDECAAEVVAVPAVHIDFGTPIRLDEEQRVDPVCIYVRAVLDKRPEAERSALWESLPRKARALLGGYKSQDPTFKRFIVRDERVLHKGTVPEGSGRTPAERIYVPHHLIERFIAEHHDGQWGGHGGAKRTHERLSKVYFWIGMWKDVSAYCATCEVCARTKGRPVEVAGLNPLLKV